jgi:arsenate reductase
VAPLTVYVHPRCSKSRALLQLLDARQARFGTVNYLEKPPEAGTIGDLVDMLDGEPADLVRVDDPAFTELGFSPADVDDRDGVVAVLVAHPELMQRPVVCDGTRAVVARPAERVHPLLT